MSERHLCLDLGLSDLALVIGLLNPLCLLRVAIRRAGGLGSRVGGENLIGGRPHCTAPALIGPGMLQPIHGNFLLTAAKRTGAGNPTAGWVAPREDVSPWTSRLFC